MVTAADSLLRNIDNPDPAIALLCIGISPGRMDHLVKGLKDQGLSIQVTYAASAEELRESLTPGSHHLVLFDARQQKLGLETALLLYRQAGSDASFLVASLDVGPPPAPEIRDLIDINDEHRAVLALRREHENVMTRRHLASARSHLEEMEHRCEALMEGSKDAIAYVDDAVNLKVNSAYTELFGFKSVEDAERMPLPDLLPQASLASFKHFLQACIAGESCEASFETDCNTTNGGSFPATIEFTTATLDGQSCAQVIVRRVENAQELETLRHLADRDPQTGVYHRCYFLTEVEKRIPQLYTASSRHWALMYIAIEGFAEIRKSCGLASADNTLEEAAQTMANHLGETVLFARLGEYTFGLFQQIESANQAQRLAADLSALISEHAFLSTQNFVTPKLKIGIALSNQVRISTAQDFINYAYDAYQTLTTGTDSPAFYSTGQNQEQVADLGGDDKLAELVDFAASHQRFELRYQSIIQPAGGNDEIYHVALCLKDANGDEYYSPSFLRPAQRAGKLLDIDRLVLERATKALAQLNTTQRSARFYLPLSKTGLQDKQLVSWLHNLLSTTRVAPQQVTLLIDDGDVRDDLQHAKLMTTALAKLGCSIMLQGFGLNAEDYTLLKHIPCIEGVTFDPNISTGIEEGGEALNRLRDLTSRIRSLGLKSVVTRADSAEQLAVIWSLGVDAIQSEFLSPYLETPQFEFSG